MDINGVLQNITNIGVQVGFKILGAIIFFIIGRKLIGVAVHYLERTLETQKVEPTVLRYLGSVVTVTLNIVLAVAILGYFGVETTTFAALLASLGVAIGLAWSGLLSNFAAGAFIIILRPFKVGDFISAGGITGTVKAIGLFATTFDTPDNVYTLVGNNKIFSDNILNYSTNGYRRVELKAQLSHSVNVEDAIKLLKNDIAKIPNVLSTPTPEVEILEFNLAGPVLAVRPYCHTDYYWQVYFSTNRIINSTFGAAGYPVPEQHVVMRSEVNSSAALN